MIPLPPLTGELVAFVVCAPIMVLLAIGIVVARKPVHSALCMAGVMVGLAVLYAAQDAPFLFVVQIIVYTGAILMLFLFVVMLIGVDSRDSVVETLKGQRVAGILAVLGLAGLLVFAVGQVVFAGGPVGLTRANEAQGGNAQGVAALLFSRYVVLLAATSALLITAAVGAMVPTVTGSASRDVRPRTWKLVSSAMRLVVCTQVRTRTPASMPVPTPFTRPRCFPTAPSPRSQ